MIVIFTKSLTLIILQWVVQLCYTNPILMSSASEVTATADVPAVPVVAEAAAPVPKMSKSAQKKLAKRLAAEKKKVS